MTCMKRREKLETSELKTLFELNFPIFLNNCIQVMIFSDRLPLIASRKAFCSQLAFLRNFLQLPLVFCEGYDYLQMNFLHSQTFYAICMKSGKHFSRKLFETIETIIHIAMRWLISLCHCFWLGLVIIFWNRLFKVRLS